MSSQRASSSSDQQRVDSDSSQSHALINAASSARTSAAAAAASASSSSHIRARSSTAAALASLAADAEYRRVRQRRQQGEEKQHQQASSASVAIAQPPLIARLHRHAQESVLGCCSLQELHTAQQVSREWMAAVKTMKPIGGAVSVKRHARTSAAADVASYERLQQVLTSRLSRHVGDLLALKLDSMMLQPICARMRSLASLTCELHLSDVAFALPSKLIDLKLTLRFDDSSPADALCHLADAVSELRYLQNCALHLKIRSRNVIRLEPLRRISALTEFSRDCKCLNMEVCPHTRALVEGDAPLLMLPSLRVIDINMTISSELLASLLQSKQRPAWERVAGTFKLDAATCALLPQVSSLVDISIKLESSTVEQPNMDFSFLAHMPHLSSMQLYLGLHFSTRPVVTAALNALQLCPQLTSLRIMADPRRVITTDFLRTVLTPLKHLRKLTLGGVKALTSLSFLMQPHLQTNLEKFTLMLCDQVDIAPEHFLQPLQGLKKLAHFVYIAGPQLSPDLRQALKTPSQLMPTLTTSEILERNVEAPLAV